MENIFYHYAPLSTENTIDPNFYYAIFGNQRNTFEKVDKLKLHQDKISAWHAFARSLATIVALVCYGCGHSGKYWLILLSVFQ
ncbi:hypothetical protein AB6F62_11280 [Providencia huaxiensis]|uniref:hypothetical protein n=1 Tax=Providencia huaxiensis TaxID=2027290 RepID=UPI0034DCE89D